MRLLLVPPLFLFASAGCDVFSPAEDPPFALWIGQTGVTVEAGASATMSAAMMETRDAMIGPPEQARWWSDDESIVAIDDDGTIQGIAPGRTGVWVEVGSKRDSATVVVVAPGHQPETRWVSVEVGGEVVCATSEAQRHFCWGSDYSGQLGDGIRRQWTVTVAPKELPTDLLFQDFAPGGEYVCARQGDGRTYCWGNNVGGATGSGGASPELLLIPSPIAGNHRFATISSAYSTAAGLTADGRLYLWGSNMSGQIGDGEAGMGAYRQAPTPASSEERFAAVEVQGFRTCALTPDGRAFCWGDNHSDALGVEGGETWSHILVPTPVRQGELRFVDLAGAGSRTCGLTEAGGTYCWPGHGFGEDAGPPEPIAPRRVEGAPPFDRIFGGWQSVCGLTPEGEAYCWGVNRHGQLGTEAALEAECPVEGQIEPTVPCTNVPRPVAGGHRFATLSTASATTCGVTTDGELYCWGSNFPGRLGAGLVSNIAVPYDPEAVHEVSTPIRVEDPL